MTAARAGKERRLEPSTSPAQWSQPVTPEHYGRGSRPQKLPYLEAERGRGTGGNVSQSTLTGSSSVGISNQPEARIKKTSCDKTERCHCHNAQKKRGQAQLKDFELHRSKSNIKQPSVKGQRSGTAFFLMVAHFTLCCNFHIPVAKATSKGSRAIAPFVKASANISSVWHH